jgi:hypothetical protein
MAANRDEEQATEDEEEAKAKQFFGDRAAADDEDSGSGSDGSRNDATSTDADEADTASTRPERKRGHELGMSPLDEMIPHPPGMSMESMTTEQWEVVLPRLQISAQVRSFAQVHGVTWFQVKVATNFEPLASWELAKRYSQFSELHRQLDDIHPFLIAPFPTKTLFSLGDDELEQRRGALHAFLRDVLRQPAIPAEAQVAALKFLGVYRRGLPEGTLLWPVPDATPPTAQEQLAWKQATANMTLEASIDAYVMLNDITWFEISVRTDFEPLGKWEVAKRYSQFSDLQEEIESVAGMLPFLKAPFPTKNLFSLTDDELEQRRGALHAFLCDLLLQPIIPATVQLAMLDFLGVYRRGLPEGTLLWPVPTLTIEQVHAQEESDNNLGRKLSHFLGIPTDSGRSSTDGGSLTGSENGKESEDSSEDDGSASNGPRDTATPDQTWSDTLLGVFRTGEDEEQGDAQTIPATGIPASPPPAAESAPVKPSPMPPPRGLRADLAHISRPGSGWSHGEHHGRRSMPPQRFMGSADEVRKTGSAELFRRVLGGGNQGQHQQPGEKPMSRMRRRKTSLLTMMIGDPGSEKPHTPLLGAIAEKQAQEKESVAKEPPTLKSPQNRLSKGSGRRVSPAGLLNLSPRHSHRRVSNFSPPLTIVEAPGMLVNAGSGSHGGRRATAIGASLPTWRPGKDLSRVATDGGGDYLGRRSTSPGALGLPGSVTTRKLKIHVKELAGLELIGSDGEDEGEDDEDDDDEDEGENDVHRRGGNVNGPDTIGEEREEEAEKEEDVTEEQEGEQGAGESEAAEEKNKYEVLLPNCSVRSLQLWAGFFFRWEGPAEEFQFLRQVLWYTCLTALQTMLVRKFLMRYTFSPMHPPISLTSSTCSDLFPSRRLTVRHIYTQYLSGRAVGCRAQAECAADVQINRT